MRRLALSSLNVLLVLMLAAVAPPQAVGPLSMQQATPAPPQPPAPQPTQVPLGLFQVPDGFEITLWAASPLLRNPTNIDIDRGRAHLGRRRGSLPLPSRPPARGRSHRRRAGQGRRWQGRDHAHVRAGTWTSRPARCLRHRQQNHRRAAARHDRLHRCRSESALRSGSGQARSAPDGLPGDQSRPFAAFGDGGAGRQVGVELRQHGGDVHGSVGKDVPHLQRLSCQPRRPVQKRARPGTLRRKAER